MRVHDVRSVIRATPGRMMNVSQWVMRDAPLDTSKDLPREIIANLALVHKLLRVKLSIVGLIRILKYFVNAPLGIWVAGVKNVLLDLREITRDRRVYHPINATILSEALFQFQIHLPVDASAGLDSLETIALKKHP